GDLVDRARASGFCCRKESHSCLRRQFIGWLHAPTKRSLSGFAREETARRRVELSSNQRERGGRHHPRRLGTVASPLETQNRYLHSGTRNQRRLPRPGGRSNSK